MPQRPAIPEPLKRAVLIEGVTGNREILTGQAERCVRNAEVSSLMLLVSTKRKLRIFSPQGDLTVRERALQPSGLKPDTLSKYLEPATSSFGGKHSIH